ncbi:MAG TPA: serine/threonine-protein kinase [Gemmataceae bacterium]|nr:serine/threonine-protein kinase [Gemmataceae bacterium]
MAVKNAVGDVLGNYNLLEKVGEGSMGTVYKASHWVSHEIVAVKVMPASIARKASLVKRFEQEFRLASMVDHPNVVRALEYNGAGAEPYLVMEFVDGVSLGDRIEKHGRIPEGEAVCLIGQVSEGLHYAHSLGLLHRDIKPDNILVTRDGAAKLTDLGLAKEVDAAIELTRTGSGLGTPNFMAPEQFRNAKHADVRCDVYSLGATLYQMIAGELPFGHGDPVRIMMRKLNNELTPLRKLAPFVSERTERAIQRAMNPEPGLRQASCQEFLEELVGRPSSPPATGRSSGVHQRPVGLRTTDRVPRAQIDARLAEDHTPRLTVAAADTSRSGVPTLPAIEGMGAEPTVPAQTPGTPLRSARYLPPGPPPAPAPVPAVPAPAGDGSRDGWKTGLLILVTAAITLTLSQVLFALFK